MDAARSEPLFSLQNAAMRVRDRRILEGTSWTVNPGEHWVVIGPNGAGKTTLLNTIIGKIPIVAGHLKRPANLRVGAVGPEQQRSYLQNERYDTPGQALDPELPLATRSAPRGGVSYLALPALVRIKGRTGGISRGTIPTKYPRVLLSLRLAMTQIGSISGLLFPLRTRPPPEQAAALPN